MDGFTLAWLVAWGIFWLGGGSMAIATADAVTSARPVQHCAIGAGGSPSEGRVSFYNDQRGYGFISPDDGSRDVFIHWKDVAAAGIDSLHRCDHVGFVAEGKPARATHIKIMP